MTRKSEVGILITSIVIGAIVGAVLYEKMQSVSAAIVIGIVTTTLYIITTAISVSRCKILKISAISIIITVTIIFLVGILNVAPYTTIDLILYGIIYVAIATICCIQINNLYEVTYEDDYLDEQDDYYGEEEENDDDESYTSSRKVIKISNYKRRE